MMQSADLRDGNDDIAFGRWLNATWDRRVAIKGQVASGIVIVIEIFRKNAAQMSFVEHDDMIETFSAYRTDYPFAVRILPRRQLHPIVTVRVELFG